MEIPPPPLPQKKKSKTTTMLLIVTCMIFLMDGILIGINLEKNIWEKGTIHIIYPNTKDKQKTSISLAAAYSGYDGRELQYDIDKFNCVNFTEYFMDYSKKVGMHCQMIRGCPRSFENGSFCHRWARCDIEPQTFRFVDYSSEFPDQYIITS